MIYFLFLIIIISCSYYFLIRIVANYKGKLSYIRTISESGLTLELSSTLKALIEFLKWKMNPENHQYLVLMLYHLRSMGRIVMEDFSAEVFNLLKLETREAILNALATDYNLKLEDNNRTQLNLYNEIEQYITEISVADKETNFILNFLELLYAFTQNAGATTKEFLRYWEEEASKKAIQASDNVDAIEIMTIHKSKGLEFPVVFLPFFQNIKDAEFSDWFETDETVVQNVNLSQFHKSFSVYDERVMAFNLRNTYKNKLDRYCLQYVATTRAVEQLFMYVEKPAKTNQLELYDYLVSAHGVEEESFDLYPIDDSIVKKQLRENKTSNHALLNLSDLSIHDKKQNNIKIATPSKNYQTRNEKVREGIFTHELLSKINKESDVDKTLTSYLLKGLITKDESVQLKENLLKLIQQYPLYFGDNLIIENERDVMITDKSGTYLHRPDRIVKTEAGWYIVDFKTGEHDAKYEQQVQRYANVLKQLGHTVLKTEIIYV